MKKAFITGVTDKNGLYLAERLLSKKYETYGLIRRATRFNGERIAHLNRCYEDQNKGLLPHYEETIDTTSLLPRI